MLFYQNKSDIIPAKKDLRWKPHKVRATNTIYDSLMKVISVKFIVCAVHLLNVVGWSALLSFFSSALCFHLTRSHERITHESSFCFHFLQQFFASNHMALYNEQTKSSIFTIKMRCRIRRLDANLRLLLCRRILLFFHIIFGIFLFDFLPF